MDKIFEIDTLEDFECVVKLIISNLTYSAKNDGELSEDLQPFDVKEAEDHVKKLLLDNNFDMKNISLLLTQKNWDRERIKYFVTSLEKKKTELLYASLNHHNSGYGETIIHSDWVLKLVLGTSELNTMKYPLLQLIFSTIGNDMQNKQMFELNKNIVMKTIQALEEITKDC